MGDVIKRDFGAGLRETNVARLRKQGLRSLAKCGALSNAGRARHGGSMKTLSVPVGAVVHESGLVILNAGEEFYRGAPLWKVTDPRDGREYLVHEFSGWAAEEEADELLGLV